MSEKKIVIMNDLCPYCKEKMIYKELLGIPYVICLDCRSAFSLNFFRNYRKAEGKP